MRKIGVIFIFIFLTGLFAGLFFSTNLSQENSAYLSSLLLYGISVSSGFFENFMTSLLSNLVPALLMLPALFTRLLCPLPPVILCCKSFSLGFCSGLIHLADFENAFRLSLLKLFPQNIFLTPAFILLSAVVFYCSAAEVTKKSRLSREKKSLQQVVMFSFALIVIGCITEACFRLIAL